MFHPEDHKENTPKNHLENHTYNNSNLNPSNLRVQNNEHRARFNLKDDILAPPELLIKSFFSYYKGALLPPYPDSFSLQRYFLSVRHKYWDSASMPSGHRILCFPVLAFSRQQRFAGHLDLQVGDSFNAVAMHEGHHPKSKDKKRVFQFRLAPNNLLGYIEAKPSEVKSGYVYRLRVVSIDDSKKSFNCVPEMQAFNQANLLENILFCNYKPK
jgi:hypothetical protein